MPGAFALATPRRIKASHRRRRRVASDHLLYILNNPLSGTDPTGYACTTGTNIKGGGGPNCESTGVQGGAVSETPTFNSNRPKPAVSAGNGGSVAQGTTGADNRCGEKPGPDKKESEPRRTEPTGTTPFINGTIGPTPDNFFDDNLFGRLIATVFGDPIAVFRSDRLNPISGFYLDDGEIQDAKLGMIASLMPAARLEAALGTALRNSADDVVLETIVVRGTKEVADSTASSVSKGRLRIDPSGTFSQSEINAAYFMAAARKSVVSLRMPQGTRAGGGTSDLLVDGVQYDVYTPVTANANRIISQLAKKNSQARGIVLDLSRTKVTSGQLGDVLARVRGAGAKNIDDVVIIGE